MGIFRKILLSGIFWYSLFSAVLIGAAFYLVLGPPAGGGIEATVTQQLLDRKRIIARAEVANITTFFEKFGNSVAFLAQLRSIEARDVDTTYDLDTFVEQRREAGLIGGVVLTDKNGVVRFNSNVMGTRDLGASLADRAYFVWAKNQGERGKYFISQPVMSRLGATKGQTIVVVASPVYQNNKFSGVVASSVKLEPLAERFLGLMKISAMTEVYLVDGNGDLLYSNSASDAVGPDSIGVGSNISELFSGDSALSDKIKNALGATVGDQFRTEKHLIAYSPVMLGTQSWLLIISSPMQQVVNLAMPLYIRQAAILILTATTILVLGVIASRKNQA